MQALWKHRRALRERGASGRMGRLGLAHIGSFHVALPLAAPLVDLLFVYGLLFGDPAVALLLWGSMLLLQLIAGVPRVPDGRRAARSALGPAGATDHVPGNCASLLLLGFTVKGSLQVPNLVNSVPSRAAIGHPNLLRVP